MYTKIWLELSFSGVTARSGVIFPSRRPSRAILSETSHGDAGGWRSSSAPVLALVVCPARSAMGQPLGLFYYPLYANVLKNIRMKKTRDLEKIVRGFSNHRRIEILQLLHKKPDLSLFQISEELRANFKTVAEHTRRLAIAGLVSKHNDWKAVRHNLSDLGRLVLSFLRTIE